jgi:hypothetical protein
MKGYVMNYLNTQAWGTFAASIGRIAKALETLAAQEKAKEPRLIQAYLVGQNGPLELFKTTRTDDNVRQDIVNAYAQLRLEVNEDVEGVLKSKGITIVSVDELYLEETEKGYEDLDK